MVNMMQDQPRNSKDTHTARSRNQSSDTLANLRKAHLNGMAKVQGMSFVSLSAKTHRFLSYRR